MAMFKGRKVKKGQRFVLLKELVTFNSDFFKLHQYCNVTAEQIRKNVHTSFDVGQLFEFNVDPETKDEGLYIVEDDKMIDDEIGIGWLDDEGVLEAIIK